MNYKRLLCLLIILLSTGCTPEAAENTQAWAELFGALSYFSDTDNDGWLNGPVNEQVELVLTWAELEMDIPTGSMQVDYEVTIGDYLYVPGPVIVNPMNYTIDARTLGVDAVEVVSVDNVTTIRLKPTQWRSRIVVTGETPILQRDFKGQKTLKWGNNNKQIEMEIPLINEFGVDDEVGVMKLTFETKVRRFADPNPDDAMADSDHDGISEVEEYNLLRIVGQGKIGNPISKDMYVVVGYTHPQWMMSTLSRRLLITVFREHGINLRVASLPHERSTVALPGMMTPDNNYLPEDAVIRLSQAEKMHEKYINGWLQNCAHLVVLAYKGETWDSNEEEWINLWGQSNGTNTVMVKSHFFPPLLGADVHQYQAKTIMHELGHNLGLCHPTETECPTGTLPKSEQDPGATVMGSPAEDSNIIAVAVSAWQRPMDYTKTQWKNIDLARVRYGRVDIEVGPPSSIQIE